MRWRPGEPRFIITSVTGYGGDGGNNSYFATVYQVLDVPYNYELVWESARRSNAERCAAALEAGDYGWVRRTQHRREYQAMNRKRWSASR